MKYECKSIIQNCAVLKIFKLFSNWSYSMYGEHFSTKSYPGRSLCRVHCPKNNLNRCIKTHAACHSWSRSNCMPGFLARCCMRICVRVCKQKPDIYRCIRSVCDRLGFYAEIQIIFCVQRIVAHFLISTEQYVI